MVRRYTLKPTCDEGAAGGRRDEGRERDEQVDVDIRAGTQENLFAERRGVPEEPPGCLGLDGYFN